MHRSRSAGLRPSGTNPASGGGRFRFISANFRTRKRASCAPAASNRGISIESLDAAKAIYRLIKYKFHENDAEREEEEQCPNVHILDLKTLTATLTGEAYTLSPAAKTFGAPASRRRKSRAGDQTDH